MALVNCPECDHEVSAVADSCPNCGHPFAPPAVRQKVVSQIPAEREGFQPWMFVPIGILAVLLVFIFIFFLSGDDTRNSNIDVNINTQRRTADRRDVDPRPVNPPNDVIVPPATTTETRVSPPSSQTIPAETQTTVIENDVPDKGLVRIEAKVTDKSGKTKPVNDEKFYLLDKQLESILREANIKTISGQTLVNTFGLSVLYPDKYGDINRKALEAIEDHVKYDVLSDSGGKAQLKGVEPGSYYLFAITKTTNGFAVWSSPVSIKPGENRLILPPARLTEVNG